MAATDVEIARIPASVELKRPARSLWGDAWHQFTRHRLAMAGLFTFLALVAFTLIGPFVYHTPIDNIDFTMSLKGPSAEHLFGTDDLGRDMLARAILGGRVSIAVGVTSVLVAITLGLAIGSLAGYFAKLDSPLMRLTDLFLSLPILPLLLVVVYLFRDALREAFGPEVGIFLMIVGVIGILNWMPVARLVRASFLSLKQKEFVEAARAIGDPDSRIIMKHIIPNVLSPVLVAATRSEEHTSELQSPCNLVCRLLLEKKKKNKKKIIKKKKKKKN